MTSELAFTVFRLGFLVLLWMLVLGTVAVLRKDIFGTVVTARGTAGGGKGKKNRGDKAQKVGSMGTPKRLVVTDGPLTGTTLPLSSQLISVGRSPTCTLVLEDPYTSSRHANIEEVDGDWIISDLGSTNGTFVDDERISEPRRVLPGETIRIGQTTFQLVK